MHLLIQVIRPRSVQNMPYKNLTLKKANLDRRRFELRALAESLKLSAGCMDCGYREHHAGLEFDHRPGETKSYNVSLYISNCRVSRFWEEVQKCDVVCSTCHSIRTWERQQTR